MAMLLAALARQAGVRRTGARALSASSLSPLVVPVELISDTL